MSTIETEALPAPVLPTPKEDKWCREQRAFHRLLPELLQPHRDQYVAIHDERVVEAGPDKLDVAERAYDRFGYVPIFVSFVTDQPRPRVRIPSSRLLQEKHPT